MVVPDNASQRRDGERVDPGTRGWRSSAPVVVGASEPTSLPSSSAPRAISGSASTQARRAATGRNGHAKRRAIGGTPGAASSAEAGSTPMGFDSMVIAVAAHSPIRYALEDSRPGFRLLPFCGWSSREAVTPPRSRPRTPASPMLARMRESMPAPMRVRSTRAMPDRATVNSSTPGDAGLLDGGADAGPMCNFAFSYPQHYPCDRNADCESKHCAFALFSTTGMTPTGICTDRSLQKAPARHIRRTSPATTPSTT